MPVTMATTVAISRPLFDLEVLPCELEHQRRPSRGRRLAELLHPFDQVVGGHAR